MSRFINPILLIIFLIFFSYIDADKITLYNGDILHGKIISLKDKKLLLKTNAMGVIIINWSEVNSLLIHEQLPIEINDGRILKGTISIESGETKATIKAPLEHGPLYIPKDKIRQINTNALKPSSFNWDAQIGVGTAAISSGAKKLTLNNRLRAQFCIKKYGYPKQKFDVFCSYNLAPARKKSTFNQGQLLIKYSHYFKNRLNWFNSEHIRFNCFQSLIIRLNEKAGIEYELLQHEGLNASINLGITRSDSFYNVITQAEKHNGFFGVSPGYTFNRNFSKDLILNNSMCWSFDISDISNYIWTMITILEAPLAKHWVAQLNNMLNYTSVLPKEMKRLDTILTLNIVYVF